MYMLIAAYTNYVFFSIFMKKEFHGKQLSKFMTKCNSGTNYKQCVLKSIYEYLCMYFPYETSLFLIYLQKIPVENENIKEYTYTL